MEQEDLRRAVAEVAAMSSEHQGVWTLLRRFGFDPEEAEEDVQAIVRAAVAADRLGGGDPAGPVVTGRELRQQNGEPVPDSKRLWLAMYALLEGAAPGISIARRLQERGESPFDDSTVFAPKSKPGTSYGSSAPRRVFDPLRPTYLQAPAQAKAAGPVDRETQRLINRAKRAQGAQPSGAELERLVRRARRAQATARP